MTKLHVGILGATGAVGQRLIEMLEGHPWFKVTEVCASERSAGKSFGDAVDWRMQTALSPAIANLVVKTCTPPLAVDFVFSALPKEEAWVAERAFASFGTPVISNASAYRMVEHIPLVIPELNPAHTQMIPIQRQEKDWKSFIVTNPNCATIGVAFPLAVAQRSFGLRKVQVTTFQARSGAGFPGPPPELIDDNVLPFISGEEDKLETEPQKILGSVDAPADFSITAHCNRVNVSDGHFECVNLSLATSASATDFKEELLRFRPPEIVAGLPSSPDQLMCVFEDDNRPQPKVDRDMGGGMTISLGRIRPCPIWDLKFVVLSHNTIRGAAGAALLNAELLVKQGFIPKP
ncbi:MAG: aspartate-semialdehyde dehydrogenase [Acidobacteria bacterium]|nr:aspartate-semialdehyde dehydrogenase [Acidobacteriota bacterium]